MLTGNFATDLMQMFNEQGGKMLLFQWALLERTAPDTLHVFQVFNISSRSSLYDSVHFGITLSKP